MGETKYGVNVTALKELKDFQLSLFKKRRNRPAVMPFINEALVSVNNSEPVQTSLYADVGILTIGDWMTMPIGHNILSMDHTENHVTIHIANHPLKKIMLSFENKEIKTMFITALGNLNQGSSSESSSTSTNSGNGVTEDM